MATERARVIVGTGEFQEFNADDLFAGLYADDKGAAVQNNGGTVTAAGTTFSGNTVYYAFGGAVYSDGTLSLLGATFTGNRNIGYHGGAVAVNGGILTIAGGVNDEYTVFSQNNAQENTAGALFIDGAATVDHAIFDRNIACNGGAIRAQSQVDISNTTFSGNYASYVGGVFILAGAKADVTVRNSLITGNNSANNGGVVYFDAAAKITFIDSFVTGNRSGSSGGVFYMAKEGQILTQGGTFSGNSASAGGFAAFSAGTLTLGLDEQGAGTVIDRNSTSAGNSGGAISQNGGLLQITGATFNSNTASGNNGNGGAINIIAGTAGIYGAVFSANSAGAYGGAINFSGDNVLVHIDGFNDEGGNYHYTLFEGNYSGGHGGAIYIGGGTAEIGKVIFDRNYSAESGVIRNVGTATVAGATFSGNWASSGSGGALRNHTGKLFTMSDALLIGNTAVYGAAFYNQGGTFSDSKSLFSGNTSSNKGGALYNSSGVVALTDSVFSGNISSDNGGAVYNAGQLTLTGATFAGNCGVIGGAVFSNSGSFTVTGGLFDGNTAGSTGGALYLTHSAAVTGAVFTGNKADSTGGAIDARNTLEISNSTFSGNSAIWGGALYLKDNANVTVTGSFFAGNSAGTSGSASGGVAFVESGRILNISGSTLSNNVSTGAGGAIHNYGGTVTLTASVLDGNRSGSGKFAGAVYNESGLLNVYGSTFSANCAASYHGGAIANKGTLNIGSYTDGGVVRRSVFSGNSASTGSVLYAENNITITDAVFVNNAAYAGTIRNQGKLTISGATFSDNYGSHDSGVFLSYSGSVANVSGSTFTGNHTGSYGGVAGFADGNGGTVSFTDSVLTGNYSGDGGVAKLKHASSLITVQGGTIAGNRASYGGAFSVENGVLNVGGALVSGNSSTLYGSFLYQTGGTVTVTDSVIDGGISKSWGGAVYLNGGLLDFAGTTIKNHTASGYGGALYLGGGTCLIADDTVFAGNETNDYGGALYLSGGTAVIGAALFTGNHANCGGVMRNVTATTVTGTTFSGNTADTSSGVVENHSSASFTSVDALFIGNTAAGSTGGAVRSDGTLNISGGSFVNNRAKGAGGAVNSSGNAVISNAVFAGNVSDTGFAGAISHSSGTLTVTAGTFSQNSAAAYHGGALAALAGTLTIQGSGTGKDLVYTVFADNTSASDGGAVHLQCTAHISDTIFTGNRSGGSGGVARTQSEVDFTNTTFSGNEGGSGGVFYIKTGSRISAANALFSGNSARNSGGVTYFEGGESLTLTDSLVTGNHSAIHGGAIYQQAGTLTVTGTTFSGNWAGSDTYAGTLYGGAVYLGGDAVNASFGSSQGGNRTVFSGNTVATAGDAYGGAVYASGNTVTFTGVIFDRNVAVEGGVMRAVSSDLRIAGSTFSGNLGSAYGGSIFNNGATTVTDTLFTGNTSGTGGAVYVAAGSFKVYDVLFSGNTAVIGGAVKAGGGSVTLSGSTFSGNIANYGGAIHLDTAAAVTLDGTTAANVLASGTDSISGNGSVTIRGALSTAASVSASTLVLDGAALTWTNDSAVNFGAFTGSVTSLAFNGSAAVNFSSADFSAQSNISVTNEALATQQTIWTIASGAAFADDQTITVNGVEAKVNGAAVQVGAAEYLLKYDDVGGLRLQTAVQQGFTAFSTGWTEDSCPATITVNGTVYNLTWGVNAFDNGTEAMSVLSDSGILAAADGAVTLNNDPFYSCGRDLYIIGDGHALSTDHICVNSKTAAVTPAGGTATLSVENIHYSSNLVLADQFYGQVINGNSLVKISGSTIGAYLYTAGGTIGGTLHTEISGSTIASGLFTAGLMKNISDSGYITMDISDSVVGAIRFSAQDESVAFTFAGETVNITDSVVNGIIDLGNRAGMASSGAIVLNLTDSTVAGAISISSHTANAGRMLNVAGEVAVDGNILAVDTLNVASDAALTFGGTVINGGTAAAAVKVVNDGLITIAGTFDEGTSVICNCTEDSQWGNLQVDGTGYLHTGNNKLYYYNVLYVDSTITGKSTGDEVMITVGDEEQLALYGINAFTSSTEAKKAGVAGPMVIAKEDFAANFYGNGTTLFANGSVAKTTYGGKLIKDDDANAGDSSLTIAGGTFGSMVVGGNRVSVDSGDVAVTAGTASLMVTGGEFNEDKSYLAAAGYLINKGTSAALTVSEAILTLAGDDVVLKKYAFGGAFADNGTANITSVNVNVSAGKYESVFAGGWAQNSGTVKVTGATVNISGGSIRNLYAGGTDSGDGNTTNTAAAVLNISGGSVRNVFLNGKYSRDTVTTATLNVTEACEINWIEGLCHSMVASSASTKTAVNIGADLTVEDILHVDEWNLTKVDTLLDFGTHTADLNGTTEAAVDTVIDFQIGEQSIGTEGWTAIAAKEFEGLGESSIKINSTFAVYDSTKSAWTSGAYTVTLNNSYDDTRKALIVTKSA